VEKGKGQYGFDETRGFLVNRRLGEQIRQNLICFTYNSKKSANPFMTKVGFKGAFAGGKYCRRKIPIGFASSLKMEPWEKHFIHAANAMLAKEKERAQEELAKGIAVSKRECDLSFFLSMITDDPAEQEEALQKVWSNLSHFGLIFQKYGVGFSALCDLGEDIQLSITNDYLGLILYTISTFFRSGKIRQGILLLETCQLDSDYIKLAAGELYYLQKEYTKCIDILDGVERNPILGPWAVIYTGLSLISEEMYLPAINLFNRALQKDYPNHIYALKEIRYYLAYCYSIEGQGQKAREEYEKILTDG
jgi:tetratricopeptide (TPR) repeat protein